MIEKITLLSRRFGDEFFASIAFDVLAQLENQQVNYVATYSGSYDSTKVSHHQTFNNTSNANVIIFHMDYLTNVSHFFDLIKNSPNKRFLLFSTQLTPEYVDSDNLQIIHWGSDMLLLQTEYQRLTGVTEKKFLTNWHWLSLSLSSRHHRVMAAMFLKGLKLDQFGHLRIDPHPLHDYKDWHEYTHWSLGSITTDIDGIFNVGFLKLKQDPVISGRWIVFDQNSAGNFEQLRNLYEHSAIEIINETTFEEPGHHVTEKFLQSVYGLNLPIVLGPPGIIAYLQSLGFDMFDDIIDIRYDSIQSPFLRLITAIKSNQRLLADRDYAIQTWRRCQSRLHTNYEFAKTQLHERCRLNVMSKIPDAVCWLTESK